ncbi:MAG TPA: YceI family protein [Gammaproteobacteria bacterium]|nr:YceI family protein [Gammaproteobacteria bacterium]
MRHVRRPLWLLPAVLVLGSAEAAPACWAPVPEQSAITFSVDQAGAPLQGSFKSYGAVVCLDPQDASQGSIRVDVQTASADTEVPELDDALKDSDFFDVTHWPQASFVSESMKETGAGQYSVTGKLTIRDVTREVTVPFTWMPAADGKTAKLTAHISIQRLDYKVGTGQWADPKWVGNQVDLGFSVVFKPAAK